MINKNFGGSLFAEKRRILIDALRKRGIDDEKVLDVMGKIPRELFVLPTFINKSYDDTALPIESDQTISQPYTVAYMTSMLEVNVGEKVLEIGTGSGYQACVLAMMGAKVFTIERIQNLFETARKKFQELGLNIHTRFGDGTIGWREHAPYNGIIVTAAAPSVPNALLEQLAFGGRLVIPVGDKDTQTMHIIERVDEETFQEIKTEKFKFVPLIGKEGWQKS
jgi:protein-L-isoaspartate(D-aspartate) O-methyltransferase